MKLAAAAAITLGLLTASGQAQDAPSLAELARQQRAVRDQQAPADRKITTEEASVARPGSSLTLTRLPAAPAPDSEAAEPATAAPPTEDQAEGNAPQDVDGGPVDPAALGEDEQAWRDAFAAARAEVERTGNRLALLQLELSDLNNQLLTRSDIYNREYQIQPMITAKEAEIREAEQNLAAANQSLEVLSTTLGRADLPLGWGR